MSKTLMGNVRFLFAMVLSAWLMSGTAWASEIPNTPENVVKQYYAALQARKYDDAYDLMTPNMIEGRTKEEHAADWKNIINMGSVILHDFGVTSVKIDGDTAKVEAWTRASDVFNKDGIIEKEIDHLKRIDGVWKLDATEVLLERP